MTKLRNRITLIAFSVFTKNKDNDGWKQHDEHPEADAYGQGP
jgi:hypothetical protein